jgi:serine/threonine-protein kinase
MHPARLGPYLIDRKIGAGGMGNVYLGRHDVTGQIAAIKELPAALAREEGFVLRFNREIEAMRKMNSPHIVKLYESGSDDAETYYYSMEYVDGETLSGRLRRERRIPWKEAVQLCLQICSGLKHAHDEGIVHRDLKPSNLLLDKNGTIKLTDFGVAQVFAAGRLTFTGAIIGTAEYMAPEQVDGRRTDRRSDLYSLGAVLYTMLVGRPPFSGGTAAEIMQKQRFGQFDAPRKFDSEIPSWLDDIVCQLLEKDPERRLPDAFVLSKRLQELLKKMELKHSTDESRSFSESGTRLDLAAAPRRFFDAILMRDLVKSQISSDEPETFFGRISNNIWVLVGMLLLVLGSVVWLWPTERSLDRDPPIVRSGQQSEADRIVQMARIRWKGGDAAGAQYLLKNLRAVIVSDADQFHFVRNIDRLLASIRNHRGTYQRAFIRTALDRAHRMMLEEREKADGIWRGIIQLYRDDSSLQDLVDEARSQLATLPTRSEEGEHSSIPAP